VDLAFSGEEVQRKFQESDFDLTFLDIHLPGMSGVECFRNFRRTKPDAKVIMMTAYGVRKELAQLRDESDFGVLRKPLDVEELVTMLKVLDRCVLPISGEDPHLVDRLVRQLDAKGYRALVARDSGEAEQKVRSDGVDVLILDMKLPVLNGLEVYKKIEKSGGSIPTVIVSGRSVGEGISEEPQAMSIAEYFAKPLAPSELLQEIETLVRNCRKGHHDDA
jgi:DNA-binding response OmpR family regulator